MSSAASRRLTLAMGQHPKTLQQLLPFRCDLLLDSHQQYEAPSGTLQRAEEAECTPFATKGGYSEG
jgi:hypothetical protein